MGVPKFFRYISERYPCLIELVKEYQMPEFDNMYLDMNGIIHYCSHPDDDPLARIPEKDIFKDIFHYLEFLFCIIKPQKLFFMAIDGVAPRAKMNQQRGRRFRTAKDAAEAELNLKKNGEALPETPRFDSNCITPGTEFMARLHEQLKYFIVNKISNDPNWQKCKIILSGHDTPGEGEHKIMDYIRYMKSQEGYDPNTRHCLFGLDADLVMLGLCTHEKNFCLLREEVKFSRKHKTPKAPEEINFFLLHISLMREYLGMEFSELKNALPFDFDLEKIIDDWVMMGFLVGNDFIPHLPNLHIQNGAFPSLYKAYMKVLPTLDGYINEGGSLNLKRFELFMKTLSELELETFSEDYTDFRFFEAKTGRKMNQFSKKDTDVTEEKCESTENEGDVLKLVEQLENNADFEVEEESSSSDSDEDDLFQAEFRLHKRDYYINKMNYKEVTPDVLKSQAEGYVRAIQWNLNYYYNGVCSWSWFYPHHYAPYITDIKDFADMKIEFDLGKPFQPYEQLLGVLPEASKELLPKCYHKLITGDDSLIKSYYPNNFETDLNGKKNDWEAIVLIPFIDEEILLKAMSPCNELLSDEEKRRNTHGPMRIYEYTNENLGEYNAPDYFPKIKNNFAKCTMQSIEDIRVPVDKLVKGPLDHKNKYCPGFSTFNHLKYTSCLQFSKIKVFEQPSRFDTMMITVVNEHDPNTPLSTVAQQVLGKTIYVQWPHLVEAMAVAVFNNDEIMKIDNGVIVKEKKPSNYWEDDMRHTINLYNNRLGVVIKDVDVVVQVKVMTGRKYVYMPTLGRLNLEKQWADRPMFYPIQTIVKDIDVIEREYKAYYELSEVFPNGEKCFYLGQPDYGALCEVYDSENSYKKGRVKIMMSKVEEPDFSSIMQREDDVFSKYMFVGYAASRTGLSPLVFAKITGSILILKSKQQDKAINVGLNLKLNKQNKEIPGYTVKRGKGWMYSEKTVNLVLEYQEKFPDLFEFLKKSDNDTNIFTAEEVFVDNGIEKVEAIMEWKKKQLASVEPRTCGAQVIEEEYIQLIEDKVKEFKTTNAVKKVCLEVKPNLLYKASLFLGNMTPDSYAKFKLYDRVVICRDNYTVPLGMAGTVIGIQSSTTNKESDQLYDVLFDEEFLMTSKAKTNKCLTISNTSIINRSHGLREYQRKTGKPGEFMQSVYKQQGNPSASQVVGGHNQSSAFVTIKQLNLPVYQVTLPGKFNDYLMGAGRNQNGSSPNTKKIGKPQTSPIKVLKKPPQKQNESPRILHPPRHINPEPVAKVEPMEDLLKKMLKIGEPAPPASTVPAVSCSKVTEAIKDPITNSPKINLQDIFAHAKAIKMQHKEQLANKKMHETNKEYFFTSQLQSIYQAQRMGNPNFKYFPLANGFYQAEIVLPNGKSLFGKPAISTKLACENAAEEAVKLMAPSVLMKKEQQHHHQISTVSVESIPHPPPQWKQNHNKQNKIQVKSHQQLFPPQPVVKNSGGTPKQEKSPSKNSAQLFVPLQAVKHIKASTPNAGKESDLSKENDTATPAVKQEAQDANASSPSKKIDKHHRQRQRKSRLAANIFKQ